MKVRLKVNSAISIAIAIVVWGLILKFVFDILFGVVVALLGIMWLLIIYRKIKEFKKDS
ncbi:MAG TPA: hypothetical protein VN721_06915 [Flavipsychrobacter sp.]|nr:hypothetical protein [Flavipsychrobacter sp.]